MIMIAPEHVKLCAMMASLVDLLLEEKAKADNPPPEWEYINPGITFTEASWDNFLATIGKWNYRIIVEFRHKDEYGPFVRGRLCVNEAGRKNLLAAQDKFEKFESNG